MTDIVPPTTPPVAPPTTPPTTPPVAPPTTPPVAPSGHWADSVSPELRGTWQNNGWDHNDPAKLAVTLTQALIKDRQALGAPADKLVKLPENDTDAAAFWARLGKPASPADYGLADFKGSDGKPFDPTFAAAFQQAAHQANLPKDAASRLFSELVKFGEAQQGAARQNRDAALASEKAELAKNWGQYHAANMMVAQQAASKLGVTPETVAALENNIGYAKTMELFRAIGQKTGEAQFVTGGGANPAILSRDQAIAKKAELIADSAWTKRYLDGGTSSAEFKQMESLLTIIAG